MYRPAGVAMLAALTLRHRITQTGAKQSNVFQPRSGVRGARGLSGHSARPLGRGIDGHTCSRHPRPECCSQSGLASPVVTERACVVLAGLGVVGNRRSYGRDAWSAARPSRPDGPYRHLQWRARITSALQLEPLRAVNLSDLVVALALWTYRRAVAKPYEALRLCSRVPRRSSRSFLHFVAVMLDASHSTLQLQTSRVFGC